MRKLYNLRMKESTNVASHINEFESLFAQIHAQKLNIDDEMKAIHLFCSLPPLWDTFCTTISTKATINGLSLVTVESDLLAKEFNKKNVETSKNGSALMVYGRSMQRGKGKESNKSQSQ